MYIVGSCVASHVDMFLLLHMHPMMLHLLTYPYKTYDLRPKGCLKKDHNWKWIWCTGSTKTTPSWNGDENINPCHIGARCLPWSRGALQVALKRMWFTSTKQPKSWEFWPDFLVVLGWEKERKGRWMESWRRGWMRYLCLLEQVRYSG